MCLLIFRILNGMFRIVLISVLRCEDIVLAHRWHVHLLVIIATYHAYGHNQTMGLVALYDTLRNQWPGGYGLIATLHIYIRSGGLAVTLCSPFVTTMELGSVTVNPLLVRLLAFFWFTIFVYHEYTSRYSDIQQSHKTPPTYIVRCVTGIFTVLSFTPGFIHFSPTL